MPGAGPARGPAPRRAARAGGAGRGPLRPGGAALLRLGCALLAAAAAPPPAAAFWFRVDPAHHVCFVEELPGVTEIVNIRYHTKEVSHAPSNIASVDAGRAARPVAIEVKDPLGKEVLRRVVTGEGVVSFKTEEGKGGEHDVCVTADFADRGAFSEVSVQVEHRNKPRRDAAMKSRDFVKGSGPGGYQVYVYTDTDGLPKEKLRTQGELQRFHLGLQDIKNEMDEVKRELSEFRTRQHRFGLTTESTHGRVWMTSAITIAVVCFITYVQYRHLKSFLLAKKLV